MGTTERAELQSAIEDLERALADAPDAMRAILSQQIEASRAALALLDASAAVTREWPAADAPMGPQLRALFAPDEAEPPPAWIDDATTRDTLRDADLRCAQGAKVYRDADSVSCALAGEAGVRMSVPHGLSVTFRHDGGMASQSLYDRGRLRWSITYHPNGRRESEGLYASDEPKQYLEHGLHTRYAMNGAVVSQCRWVAGRRHGWLKLWEDDGRPISATRYLDGREVERVLPSDERSAQ
ncbi:MAG: hypothetical protein U0326_40750 [Polyangiales bacterium]